MKMRMIGLIALALAIFPMAFIAAEDLPSAQSIVDKYIEATGGESAYMEIKNSVQKTSILIVAMGMTATGTNYVEGPNAKSIMAIDGFGEFLSGIKDGTPWSSNMMAGDQILSGAEAKAALAQADPQMWLNWKNYYASAETVGEEAVGDATAWKIAFTPDEGQAMTYWFDKESGLIIQSEGPGLGGGVALNTMSDYRDVGDVMVPFKIVSEGGQGQVDITVDSVEHNTTIDASVFDVPESIATLMSGESEEGSDDKEEDSDDQE